MSRHHIKHGQDPYLIYPVIVRKTKTYDQQSCLIFIHTCETGSAVEVIKKAVHDWYSVAREL